MQIITRPSSFGLKIGIKSADILTVNQAHHWFSADFVHVSCTTLFDLTLSLHNSSCLPSCSFPAWLLINYDEVHSLLSLQFPNRGTTVGVTVMCPDCVPYPLQNGTIVSWEWDSSTLKFFKFPRGSRGHSWNSMKLRYSQFYWTPDRVCK